MRPQDRRVFCEAAAKLKLWILVRRTNPASLRYIGLANYVPKPIDCKAKTADRDGKQSKLAGLVADPTLCPEAFGSAKLSKAQEIWKQFSAEQRIGAGGPRYGVITDARSPHYGAVTLLGSFVHGDYDLYDIIDPEQAQRNLAAVESQLGQLHMRGPNFYKVQQYVNTRIGSPMVQHGGEAQYTDHSEQSIDAFGPDGEDVTILNEFSVRAWYKERFAGRKSIVLPH